MTEQFWYGFIVGAVCFAGFWISSARTYKHTLMLCAAGRTAEKLPDGKFYYIVEEGEYVRMREAA